MYLWFASAFVATYFAVGCVLLTICHLRGWNRQVHTRFPLDTPCPYFLHEPIVETKPVWRFLRAIEPMFTGPLLLVGFTVLENVILPLTTRLTRHERDHVGEV